jgi:four helix bundle protein
MSHGEKKKVYDLEERTFQFAKNCRTFVKQLTKTIGNIEDGRQLVRSSGSVHANFVESVEGFSKRDTLHRVKICRKEAKESTSWLRLIDSDYKRDLDHERKQLVQEAGELTRIFGAIVTKKSKSP